MIGFRSLSVMALLIGSGLAAGEPSTRPNDHYLGNRPPLLPRAFIPLPPGAVKPSGWLKDQLEIQAKGLTGNIENFWPDLGPESGWKGGNGESWERGPYYLDGLVPLGYLLEDESLREKARTWIEWILQSSRTDGWFGPEKNRDRWPLAVALKVLTQYHEATGDDRVIELMEGYFRYLRTAPPRSDSDTEWYRVRAMESVLSAYWLYNRTGDPELLVTAQSIHDNSYDWPDWAHFFRFSADTMGLGPAKSHWAHNVNIAMAFKFPGVRYQQSGETYDRDAVHKAFANIEAHHGQANGLFGGDEHLSGKHPSQGIELCGVVETMFSLENLVSIFGDPVFADRLERIAYNALPGTFTPDFWAHQYDQQTNQVLCTVAKRNWSSNGDHANIYGLEPNYGCCTANLHQGWPKFVAHLWMASPNNGLAAVAYGPCVVEATVGEGTHTRITVETDYPFKETLTLQIEPERHTRFPLTLRVPGWAEGARISIEGAETEAAAGTFVTLDREWRAGDRVEMHFPMKVRTETRFNSAASILRGPLVYSLKIGEHFHQIAGELPHADWEIYPTSDWNYGLILDPVSPEHSFEVREANVSKTPFSNDAPPVTLRAKGMRIPYWYLKDNSADAPPANPVKGEGEANDIELIPYGCSRLRITEFPVLR